jgi:hypothetical protein
LSRQQVTLRRAAGSGPGTSPSFFTDWPDETGLWRL